MQRRLAGKGLGSFTNSSTSLSTPTLLPVKLHALQSFSSFSEINQRSRLSNPRQTNIIRSFTFQSFPYSRRTTLIAAQNGGAKYKYYARGYSSSGIKSTKMVGIT
jgi:hypothetical protein